MFSPWSKKLGREKQRFSKWGLWRETKEKPRKPHPREKPRKQGNKEMRRKTKMRESKQSQAVYQYMESRVKSYQCIKIIPFVVDQRKSWFLQRRIRERSRKKMKSVRKGASDGTVPEECNFERLNVNFRSASDVKS